MKWVVTMSILVLTTACGSDAPWRPKPKVIRAADRGIGNTLFWGGDSVFMTAKLGEIKAALIPKRTKGQNGENITNFDVVCIALVSRSYQDYERYKSTFSFSAPSVTIKFELISTYGLILASGTETINLVSSNSIDRVPCRLTGVSEEEVGIASHVEVAFFTSK